MNTYFVKAGSTAAIFDISTWIKNNSIFLSSKTENIISYYSNLDIKMIRKIAKSGSTTAKKTDTVHITAKYGLHITKEYNHFDIDKFDNYDKITELHCRNISQLPENIGKLTNLEVLNCSHNKLKSLPDSIGDLKNLDTLDCSSNKLTSLPDSITKLPFIDTLNCSENELISLPEDIGNLITLGKLVCGENNIEALPASIVKLRNLKYLVLDDELWEDIPKEIEDFINIIDTRYHKGLDSGDIIYDYYRNK